MTTTTSLPNTLAARTLPTGECLKRRRFGCSYRQHRGQTTVEFAIICLPFFAILFAIVDYAQIYFYENSLQNAMREAARFATAGRIIQQYYANGSPVYETNNGVVMYKAIYDANGNEASRNECIRYWFQSNCIIHIPIAQITIVSAPTLPGVEPNAPADAYGKLHLLTTNGLPPFFGPGAANDYIQVTATNTIATITPLVGFLGGFNGGAGGQNFFSYNCYVSAIVKNEPALLNFLHTNVYTSEPGYYPGNSP